MSARRLGFVLMYAGFFAAAFFGVRRSDAAGLEWQTIEWPWYILCFAFAVLGVVIVRMTAVSAETQTHKIDADMTVLDDSLTKLLQRIAEINARKDTVGVYDMHGIIDRDLTDPLANFVDARESMIPRFGLQPYADVMSKFALCERNINRAWSASADGYIDEAWSSLQRAESLMQEARDLFSQNQRAVNS